MWGRQSVWDGATRPRSDKRYSAWSKLGASAVVGRPAPASAQTRHRASTVTRWPRNGARQSPTSRSTIGQWDVVNLHVGSVSPTDVRHSVLDDCRDAAELAAQDL